MLKTNIDFFFVRGGGHCSPNPDDQGLVLGLVVRTFFFLLHAEWRNDENKRFVLYSYSKIMKAWSVHCPNVM